MISVVMPTIDAETGIGAALAALVPAVVDGVVREVIVVDGGSSDRTIEIADGAGAVVVRSEPGRGIQLAAGAARARFPWLMFLHADTVLDDGWHREAARFIDRVDRGERPRSAAAFGFALDDPSVKARLLEAVVAARCRLMRLPYGDQGLLVPRRLYDEVGGFRPLPLMEDVDLMRRIGRSRTTMLRTRAITSAERYRREGYVARITRNSVCLMLFFLRVPPRIIARVYASPTQRAGFTSA